MTARDYQGLPHTCPTNRDTGVCDACVAKSEDLAYGPGSFTERLADVRAMLARNGHTDGPKAA